MSCFRLIKFLKKEVNLREQKKFCQNSSDLNKPNVFEIIHFDDKINWIYVTQKYPPKYNNTHSLYK